MSVRNKKFSYYCTNCNCELYTHPVKCPECNSPLNITGRIKYLESNEFNPLNQYRSLWRYFDLLPLSDKEFILSLSEGFTPLHKSRHIGSSVGIQLYFKDETKNPSGSFKDRGISTAMSYAQSIGINKLGIVSTGNSGISFSLYSGLSNIGGYIYVPESTSEEKKILLKLYGAKMRYFTTELLDTRSKEIELSENEENTFIKAHLHAFYFEGQKTLGFEILENLEWYVPDYIVVPTGGGTLLLSMWKGFQELFDKGIINSIPKPICVQAEGCSPIVKAFNSGMVEVEYFEESSTIAESIKLSYPSLGNDVVKAISEYKGIAETVNDREIIESLKLLAKKEGLFVEPACATTVAVLNKLRENNRIKKDSVIVSILTGHGYKSVKDGGDYY